MVDLKKKNWLVIQTQAWPLWKLGELYGSQRLSNSKEDKRVAKLWNPGLSQKGFSILAQVFLL